MNIGLVIRHIRKRKGITLEQLALATKADMGNLPRPERGKLRFNLGILQAIAAELGVSVSYICQQAEMIELPKTSAAHQKLFQKVTELNDAEARALTTMADALLRLRSESLKK